MPLLRVAFSRRLAIVAGLLLPVLETARRWQQWPGPIRTWPPWLDDYLIGAFLLLGAWLSGSRAVLRDDAGSNRIPRCRRLSWLTAAWGFACGMGFGSTLAQFNQVINPQYDYQDPSGMGHGWVVLAKASLVAVGVVGLVASMRAEDTPQSVE